jgi:predicted glutamine amidotransferase
MCGITGIYIKNPKSRVMNLHDEGTINIFIDALLLGIEHRGKDSTGLVSSARGGGEPFLEKDDKEASEFIKYRKEIVPDTRFVLGHTRFSTKGIPEILENDHPVQSGNTFVVHNGHISNDDELFAENEDITRIAQVDTEIIPALLEKHGLDKAHLAFQKLDGNFAVASCNVTTNPDTVVLAKGPISPFIIWEHPDMIVWASTKLAIENAFKVVDARARSKFFGELKSGDIKILTPKRVENLRFQTYYKPYVAPPHGHGFHSIGKNSQYLDRIDAERRRARDDEFSWVEEKRRKYSGFCKCGETQWWHDGPECQGRCLLAVSHCEKFEEVTGTQLTVVPSEDAPTERQLRNELGKQYVACALCTDLVPLDECIELYDMLVCDECNTMPDPLREQGKVPDSGQGRVIDYDSDLFRLKYDAEVVETARVHDISPGYVEWLLFEATDEIMKNHESLINTYCLVTDTHSKLLIEACTLPDPDKPKTEKSGVQPFAGIKTDDA